MSQIYILVEYNEKWEKVDGGFWRWFGVGMSKGFVLIGVSIFGIGRDNLQQNKY